MDEEFLANLLKSISASMFFMAGMTAAREMYGKSYFSLGHAEKTALDQVVLGFVGSNFQSLTPEALRGRASQQPVGFQAPSAGS